jgi:hypothetical protein
MKDGSSGWADLHACNLGLFTVLVIVECIAAFPIWDGAFDDNNLNPN